MRIQFNSLRKRMQVRVSHKIVGGKPKALYLDPGLEAVRTEGTDVATPLVHHRSRGDQHERSTAGQFGTKQVREVKDRRKR